MCQTDHGVVLVHSPTGVVRIPERRPHAWAAEPAAALLRGMVVVDNLIPGMAGIAAAVARRWPTHFPTPVEVREVPHSRLVPEQVNDDLSTRGVAMLGLGNCGACTTWLAEFAADLVIRMPVAVVVTERFRGIANARLTSLGEVDLPVLVVPNEAADEHADLTYLDSVADALIADASAAWSLS